MSLSLGHGACICTHSSPYFDVMAPFHSHIGPVYLLGMRLPWCCPCTTSGCSHQTTMASPSLCSSPPCICSSSLCSLQASAMAFQDSFVRTEHRQVLTTCESSLNSKHTPPPAGSCIRASTTFRTLHAVPVRCKFFAPHVTTLHAKNILVAAVKSCPPVPPQDWILACPTYR